MVAIDYFVQQLINGATIGCIYALVAMGYTLVHGITGQINLAHGDIFMIGAFGATIAVIGLGILGIGAAPWVLPTALVAAIAFNMVYGWSVNRMIYRPLRVAPGYSAIVATLGFAIFLREYVRLLHGARSLWLEQTLKGGLEWSQHGDFAVFLGYTEIFIFLLTAVALTVSWFVVERTRVGRAGRAIAQDATMATLLGIDAVRTSAAVFVLTASLAAVAGLMVSVHYGVIDFFMGFVFGLKALTAAIIGGIGSLPGAVVGGLLIGLLETMWSAYFQMIYRDVVVFGILIAALVFRPDGLFGRPHAERAPGPGQPRH
ncbi:MAG: branched-chain amino acid ABC transporter permease LivH [Rhodospirillales bacterium]|jgi:branched-chain amino acid transport system permease protein|nr:branched-chain amino acid ABC transporter permease LivH [Rhodospirillales bacterium]